MKTLNIAIPVLLVLGGTGGCVPCCGEAAPDVRVACRSETAEPVLQGFSGNRPSGNVQEDNDPTAPWNTGPIWKWRRETLLVGSYYTPSYYTSYESPGCSGNSTFVLELGTTYSGLQSHLVNNSGECATTNDTLVTINSGSTEPPRPVEWQCGHSLWLFHLNETDVTPRLPLDGTVIWGELDDRFRVYGTYSASLTTERVDLDAHVKFCDYTTGITADPVVHTRRELSEPDLIEDAMDRVPLTPGESCCAATPAFPTTAPYSYAPLPCGQTTRVAMTIFLKGTPHRSYDIQFSFENYVVSTGARLADTYETVGFATDAEGLAIAELDIEQPLPDRRRCLLAWGEALNTAQVNFIRAEGSSYSAIV